MKRKGSEFLVEYKDDKRMIIVEPEGQKFLKAVKEKFTDLPNDFKLEFYHSGFESYVTFDEDTDLETYKKFRISTQEGIPGSLPDKVSWVEPIPLLSTFGVKWDYQPHPDLEKLILEHLPAHFEAWKNNVTDKQYHPLFLALSGVGTGKSRLLQELPRLVKSTKYGHHELQERFENSYIFHVSFENGTSPLELDRSDISSAIGTRMLWQLLRNDSRYESFIDFRKKFQVSPTQVISLVASSEKKNLEEMTVFILVDGIHSLPHQPNSKESPFYYALATISNLVNSSRSFIIGCCAATVHLPVSNVLASTAQRRVSLPVTPLDGRLLFKDTVNNPLFRLIIEDMSGHGRALESLGEVLAQKGMNIDFSTLMNIIKDKLKIKYPTWVEMMGKIYPVLKNILGNKKFFSLSDSVPGTDWSVDDVCSFGLIRYDAAKSVLTGSYIWIWLLSEKYADLRPFICDYQVVQDMFKTAISNPFQWELFNGNFRCLKSLLFPGDNVDFLQLHSGALFNLVSNPKINGIPLQLIQTSKQYATRTSLSREKEIKGQFNNYEAYTGKYFFINGTASPAGDGWCDLKATDTGKNIREIHQYKLVQGKIKSASPLIKNEREKAADEEDIFLLLTIFKSKETIKSSDLPKNTGLVYFSNFSDYYGPFAARAFHFVDTVLPSVNYSSRKQLMAVEGLGETKVVDELIKERKASGPFKDLDDLASRMKKRNSKFSRNDFITVESDKEVPKVDFYYL